MEALAWRRWGSTGSVKVGPCACMPTTWVQGRSLTCSFTDARIAFTVHVANMLRKAASMGEVVGR